jgi:hypothetical protein
MLKRNTVFVLFFHESPVFLCKGNGFGEEFECTENTKCGSITSDARWVNLWKYKVERQRITQGG